MYYYITIDNILVESSREVNNASYLPITEETYYQLQAEFAKKALEEETGYVLPYSPTQRRRNSCLRRTYI